MKTNPDEYAFPSAHSLPDQFCGLTKREYFAAAALQGLCANPNVPHDWACNYAINIADELIAKLNKTP